MCTSALTSRLRNTARVLQALPTVLDLADDRELGILAAVLEGYAQFGGPGNWETSPGYFELVAFAAMIHPTAPADRELIASYEVHGLLWMLEYLQDHLKRHPIASGEPTHLDIQLLNSAVHLAHTGEPVDLANNKTKPCTMARAFELALAKSSAKPQQHSATKARSARRKPAKARTAATARTAKRKAA